MPDTMRAQVFYEPGKMSLEEVPVPQIAEDEVLVLVNCCGICGSDIAYYFGDASLETESGKGPLILGHEYAGTVVKRGSMAAGLLDEGDRVVLNPVQYCNACGVCGKGQTNLCENKSVLGVSVDGGFAEYSKSKVTATYKLPDGVTLSQAAFAEPLADAVYAVQNASIGLGDFVVVFGPGAIGLMMVQLAKAYGAGTIVLVGTRDYRLEAGKAMGANVVLNPTDKDSQYYCADVKEAIGDLTKGMFADRAITATGSLDSMHMALEITGRKSIVVFFGLPGDADVVHVPALPSILWDKTIRFSWLAPGTWPVALQALANGLVDVSRLGTHTYPLESLAQGLTEVKNRVGNPLKAQVVLEA